MNYNSPAEKKSDSVSSFFNRFSSFVEKVQKKFNKTKEEIIGIEEPIRSLMILFIMIVISTLSLLIGYKFFEVIGVEVDINSIANISYYILVGFLFITSLAGLVISFML